ncbi:hypothetical protein KJ996_03125 [Patescibacteria group bacterium]|nr:hypothetical protein [Patescibacteria group bacterium]
MDTNTQPQGETFLTWTAPVTPEPVRSKAWYVIAIIAALLMLFYSIKTGAWTFTGVLVLGIGLYIFAHRKEQPEKTISIQKDGVRFDEEFIPWSCLDMFWIVDTPQYSQLHIHRKELIKNNIIISIQNTDISQLRAVLAEFITENLNIHEKLFDKISRICKL